MGKGRCCELEAREHTDGSDHGGSNARDLGGFAAPSEGRRCYNEDWLLIKSRTGSTPRARTKRIDRIELCPVAQPLQQMMEEDGMRLARVRSPQHDEIGLLDLLIRARLVARAEHLVRPTTLGACQVQLQLSTLWASNRARELLRD